MYVYDTSWYVYYGKVLNVRFRGVCVLGRAKRDT